MIIISWNIHYDDLENKYSHIMEKKPDVLILQECKKNSYDIIKKQWNFKNWYNDDLNEEFSDLGIAIFSNEYRITFTEQFNRNYRYIIPYKISNNGYDFIVFITWTKTKSKFTYTENITTALNDEMYADYFKNECLLVGDFNTGATLTNDMYYKKIIAKGIINNTSKSDEYKDTYFQFTNGKGTYYINDYCFSTKKMNDNYQIKVKVEEFDRTIKTIKKYNNMSDHCPLIIEVIKKEKDV